MRVSSTIPRLLVRQGRRRLLSMAAKSSQSQLQNRSETTSDSSSMLNVFAIASAMILAGTASTVHLQADRNSEKDTDHVALMASSIQMNEPVRQPRNVMLHRMRSEAGRGLNDKYNVDWSKVLGGKGTQKVSALEVFYTCIFLST